jgi:beta-1,4-mannosyl-glycoprotein beta-1,4-N-acetylglucosaminyltransferase
MTVYSATQFCNEIDLLYLRLEILDPLVDYHIITESNITHSGISKPFNYEDNMEIFKKFWPKIKYQKFSQFPKSYEHLDPDTTDNELLKLVYQKLNAHTHWPKNHNGYGNDAIEKEIVLLQMGDCKPEDIIISSDLDEIPDPKSLKEVLDNFEPDKVYNFKQRMFYYYLNIEKEDNWIGPTVMTFEKFKYGSVSDFRLHRRDYLVNPGGWHWSYMGGVDKVKDKVEAINEYQFNVPIVKDNLKANIDNCLVNGHDLFYRPCKFWKVPINLENYPAYLVEHIDEYKDYIKE